MNDDDCLDLTALDRLGKFKRGAQFVREMIDIFLGYGPQKIAEAHAAEQAGDLAAVGHAVHPLVSGAGNVGARVVRELAMRIERLARENDRPSIAPLLRELDEAYARAKVRLEEARRSL